MITNDTRYACGEILSLSVAEENDPPGFVTYLSQGIAVGALLMLPNPVWGVLLHPYYGVLFIGALPWFLALGGGFGIFEAIIIWACTYVARRRLNWALRIGIAFVVLAALIALFQLLFWERSPYEQPPSQTDYLIYIGWYVLAGVLFGLVIGSRIKPLNELARGVSPARWQVITAITGLVLRFTVVLLLLYMTVILAWLSRANTSHKQFVFAVITLIHFAAAAMIVFIRMPYWLLLPLAVIVNFPVAAYIKDVVAADDPASRAVALNYLVVWAAFLSCRVQLPFHGKKESE